ncbi:serine acetyltransferase [Vibrio alginolyticus]|nr:serine acetyltransferase [Vibrio alginolyticus]
MIESKSELKFFLEEDRIQLNKARRKPRLIGDEVWIFQRLLRYEEYHTNNSHRIRAMIYKIIRHRLGIKLGFTIPINVFSHGLSIAHYGTIIVNKDARIGKNCRLHACVNIGTMAGKSGCAPKIGDNCYIGPGAKLFGDIELGNNIAIGANAVVNKSFPEGNVTIGGVPARVISQKSSDGLWLKNEEIEYLSSIGN